jgi:hypothetical protein
LAASSADVGAEETEQLTSEEAAEVAAEMDQPAQDDDIDSDEDGSLSN